MVSRPTSRRTTPASPGYATRTVLLVCHRNKVPSSISADFCIFINLTKLNKNIDLMMDFPDEFLILVNGPPAGGRHSRGVLGTCPVTSQSLARDG